MRLVRRIAVALLVSILVVVIFLPPIVGIGIQKWLKTGTFFLDLKDNPNIQVIEYKRGWFSSDIVSRVKVNDPSFREWLGELGISQPIPAPFEILVKQHVQHGPIFYSRKINFLHSFGWLAVDRKLIFSKSEQEFLKQIGLADLMIDRDQTVLDFRGRFYSRITLKQFNTILPYADFHMQFENVVADVWQDVFAPRMRGKITLQNVVLQSDLTIVLPKVVFDFDFRKNKKGLWLGSHAVTLSEMKVSDQNNESFVIRDIQSDGVVNEKSGLVNAQKNVTFKNFQYEDESFGPLSLRLSVDRINASAILAMIDAYKDIQQYGELYESQLKQKLLAILPSAVTPGASIQMNNLDITTPRGQLRLQAKVFWPNQNYVEPASFEELVQSSKVLASLRIAIPLADQMIGIFARITYLNQIPVEQRMELQALNEQLRQWGQRNTYEVMGLMQLNLLSQEEGMQLLSWIRDNNISYENYSGKVKELMLARKISLGDSYFLDWLYWSLVQASDSLDQRLLHYQKVTEAQLRAELKEFLKIGYLTQDRNDYLISLVRENGSVTVNGKPLS